MRIAVSKGHNVYNNNIFDNGASGNGKREAYEVDKTVDILISMLRNQGHYVVDVTPKNEHFKSSKEAHKERAKRVNKGSFDIYIDVHLNAGGGTGSEMWVYAPRGLSYDYARDIVNNIVSDTGLRNRGVKVKPTMWSLSMTNCPSIIIEGGFIDSKKDMDIITPELYARSIAKAFGEVPGVVKPTNEIYRVRKSWEDIKSQKGAYSILDNAIKLAKELGYKVYDGKGIQIYPIVKEVKLLKYKRLLKTGVKGDDVKEYQSSLNKLGYDSGTPDGIFGGKTNTATRNLQVENKLKVDGLVGRVTIDKINELLEKLNGGVTVPKPNPQGKVQILRPDRQTTIVKIPFDMIDELDVAMATTSNGRMTMAAFQKKFDFDFSLNLALFWNHNGKSKPLNLFIDNGKQIYEGTYSRFGLRTFKDKSFDFDWYKWSPDLKDMIGGSPSLIINGKKHIDKGSMSGGLITARHPRSAVGVDEKNLYLITVDGRNASKGHYGMTIDELANLGLKLGLTNFQNNDGGGSVRMLEGNKVLNSPTENRAIQSVLGINLKQ